MKELGAIESYLVEQGSPAAASRVVERVRHAIQSLEHAPLIGRPVSRSVRELTTVRPYLIRDRVRGATVEVIRIRHAARRPTE